MHYRSSYSKRYKMKSLCKYGTNYNMMPIMNINNLHSDILKLILEQCKNISCAFMVCKRWFAILGAQKLKPKYFISSIPLMEWARNNGYIWNYESYSYAA